MSDYRAKPFEAALRLFLVIKNVKNSHLTATLFVNIFRWHPWMELNFQTHIASVVSPHCQRPHMPKGQGNAGTNYFVMAS